MPYLLRRAPLVGPGHSVKTMQLAASVVVELTYLEVLYCAAVECAANATAPAARASSLGQPLFLNPHIDWCREFNPVRRGRLSIRILNDTEQTARINAAHAGADWICDWVESVVVVVRKGTKQCPAAGSASRCSPTR